MSADFGEQTYHPFDPAPRDGGESDEDLVKLFDSIKFELGEMPSREERNAS